MTTSDETETVTAWADGFGIWHVRIDFPGGYGPAFLDANWSRIRAKARRAVKRELLSRYSDSIGPIRLVVEENNLDHMNLMRSITFKETGGA